MGFFGTLGKAFGALPGIPGGGGKSAAMPGAPTGGLAPPMGGAPAAPPMTTSVPWGKMGGTPAGPAAPGIAQMTPPVPGGTFGQRPKIVKGPNGISKVVSPPGTVFPNFASDGPRQTHSISQATDRYADQMRAMGAPGSPVTDESGALVAPKDLGGNATLAAPTTGFMGGRDFASPNPGFTRPVPTAMPLQKKQAFIAQRTMRGGRR